MGIIQSNMFFQGSMDKGMDTYMEFVKGRVRGHRYNRYSYTRIRLKKNHDNICEDKCTTHVNISSM